MRDWLVLLVGGASGVGKTHVSYRLAHHYVAGLTEVDDLQIVLERMTTPEQQPVLHYWRTHPAEALRWDDSRHLAHFQAYGAVMHEALIPVLANHLETETPMIFEGDFLLPALATHSRYGASVAQGRVRGVFLHEADEAQIVQNYRAREGTDQRQRAHISWVVGNWLRAEAERLGIPTVAARPWDTVLERVIAAVDGG